MSNQADSATVFRDGRLEIRVGENEARNLVITSELLPQQEMTEPAPEIDPPWGDISQVLPEGEHNDELRGDLRQLSEIYRNNWDRLFSVRESPLGWVIWDPERYLGEEVAALAMAEGSWPGRRLLSVAQGKLIARFDLLLADQTRHQVHPGGGAKVLVCGTAPGNSILKAMRTLEMLAKIEGSK